MHSSVTSYNSLVAKFCDMFIKRIFIGKILSIWSTHRHITAVVCSLTDYYYATRTLYNKIVGFPE